MRCGRTWSVSDPAPWIGSRKQPVMASRRAYFSPKSNMLSAYQSGVVYTTASSWPSTSHIGPRLWFRHFMKINWAAFVSPAVRRLFYSSPGVRSIKFLILITIYSWIHFADWRIGFQFLWEFSIFLCVGSSYPLSSDVAAASFAAFHFEFNMTASELTEL